MSIILFLASVPAMVAPPVGSVAPGPLVFDYPSLGSGEMGQVTTLDVEVRSGSDVLWTGEMRVSSRQGASVVREQTNAPASPCSGDQAYPGPGERSALSINVNQYRIGQGSGSLQLRVNWDRPGDGAGCQRTSARTVGISETLSLKPGGEQIIKGDGGLVVRIRRR